MAQAQEEANRTLTLAKRQGEDSLAKDAIVRAAHERAEQILDQARADVETVRRDSDEYVVEALSTLEDELIRLLNQARNGIAKVSAERQRQLPQEELAEQA
jgi:DNA-directed RNA polymerase subunit K/omega